MRCMALFWCAALVVGAAAAPRFASAQTAAPPAAPIQTAPSEAAPTQSKTLVFQFIRASDFAASLLPPEDGDVPPDWRPINGLLRLSPNDARNTVFVEGSPDAIERAQALAALLDVEARSLQIKVRILRGPSDARVRARTQLNDGIVVTDVLGLGKNNRKMVLQAVGDGELFRITLIPKVNADNSVTITAELDKIVHFISTRTITTQRGEMKREDMRADQLSSQWTRRIPSGGRVIAASVSNNKDPDTAYYLEIAPTLVSPAVREKP